jgi:hypothetical protein
MVCVNNVNRYDDPHVDYPGMLYSLDPWPSLISNLAPR